MKGAIKKISTVVVGRTLYEISNYFFDYGVYPLALLKFGYINGLLIMIAVTAFSNFAMLLFYFKMNIDWLGYDYVKQVKDWSVNKKGVKKIIGVILKKSDLILFMVLSTFRDSFETTAYFKYCYNLSKGRTVAIFITSLIVSNIFWASGVEVFINSWLRYLINF